MQPSVLQLYFEMPFNTYLWLTVLLSALLNWIWYSTKVLCCNPFICTFKTDPEITTIKVRFNKIMLQYRAYQKTASNKCTEEEKMTFDCYYQLFSGLWLLLLPLSLSLEKLVGPCPGLVWFDFICIDLAGLCWGPP